MTRPVAKRKAPTSRSVTRTKKVRAEQKPRNKLRAEGGRPKKRNEPQPIREVLKAPAERCAECGTDLRTAEKALFVEEEVGRVFCSEPCISNYFGSDIERMEKEYLKLKSNDDLPAGERKKLEHLRWVTLQEPDEVWREKTLSGDQRYTLIAEFSPRKEPVWCLCLCLFLRGEPSFLYLALVTQDPELVDHYRRGERVEWESLRDKARPETRGGELRGAVDSADEAGNAEQRSASLAEPFTHEEMLRAAASRSRSDQDISSQEFSQYQAYLEPTLETPDEVWSIAQPNSESDLLIYHFIKQIRSGDSTLWYVIVAQETDTEEDQLEILDAFPTRDPQLVEQFRRGQKEVGEGGEAAATSKALH